jgi:hypothetical protein
MKIAYFRRNSGKGIQKDCRRFVELCRVMRLFLHAILAVGASKSALDKPNGAAGRRAEMPR